MESETETVHTWCDAYGVWHARVTFPSPYGPQYLATQIDRIRAKARRAIRAEIVARTAPWHDPTLRAFRCRVHVSGSKLDSMNRMWDITYTEGNAETRAAMNALLDSPELAEILKEDDDKVCPRCGEGRRWDPSEEIMYCLNDYQHG